jgi:hypothetical protein
MGQVVQTSALTTGVATGARNLIWTMKLPLRRSDDAAAAIYAHATKLAAIAVNIAKLPELLKRSAG